LYVRTKGWAIMYSQIVHLLFLTVTVTVHVNGPLLLEAEGQKEPHRTFPAVICTASQNPPRYCKVFSYEEGHSRTQYDGTRIKVGSYTRRRWAAEEWCSCAGQPRKRKFALYQGLRIRIKPPFQLRQFNSLDPTLNLQTR